jgi:glutamate-1-semialdehyde 2,1-aminomutase
VFGHALKNCHQEFTVGSYKSVRRKSMTHDIWNGYGIWALWPLGLWLVYRLWHRLCLSLAKAPGLIGHVRWARRISRWLPAVSWDLEAALSIDGAPDDLVRRRRQALVQLQTDLQAPIKSVDWTRHMLPHLPDLQLINTYRVPFPFQAIAQTLPISSVWGSAHGNRLYDLDQKPYWDLTGSYGVNVLGTDFYKAGIRQAETVARELGPVLGSYHPLVAENVDMLRRISGHEQVTFHMSGTEAVMQAVRLARYHTRKPKIVRFAGAYHGWWDDVQPGPGNPSQPSDDTLTLRDMHPMSLRVLAQRRDVACVLVNPIQAMHPNRSAPGDSTLMVNGRQAHFDPEAYTKWLQALRALCTRKGIALIIDEVFLGFRVAHRGVQGFYGVQADLVTYGKTLGGGLPVGAVCGSERWMRRFNPERPGDICFARGTFNAHPYVMASMHVFLRHWLSEAGRIQVEQAQSVWAERLDHINRTLQARGIPIRFVGWQTVWTLIYDVPARYNWMFQYYLRKHGLALSWVGTGRWIFNFSYTDTEFEQVVQAVLSAGQDMIEGGWWAVRPGTTRAAVQRRMTLQLLGRMIRRA